MVQKIMTIQHNSGRDRLRVNQDCPQDGYQDVAYSTSDADPARRPCAEWADEGIAYQASCTSERSSISYRQG